MEQTARRRSLGGLSLGRKLGVAFAVMVGLTVALATVVFFLVSKENRTQGHLVEVGYPTVAQSSRMLGELNGTQAALRSYMMFRDEESRADWREAWETLDEVAPELRHLSRSWRNSAMVAKIEDLEKTLATLRGTQERIVALVGMPAEQPGLRMMDEEATPRAAQMLAALTTMMNDEEQRAATPERRTVLRTLADCRYSLSLGLAALRAKLLTGEEQHAVEFRRLWSANESALQRLLDVEHLLSFRQREELGRYHTLWAEFAPLPQRLFDLRDSDRWNAASRILASEALPQSRRARSLLQELITGQLAEVDADTGTLSSASSLLLGSTVLTAAVAVLIGSVLAWSIPRSLVSRTRRMVDLANRVAQGDLTSSLPVTTRDELGEVAEALNETIATLRRTVDSVLEASDGVSRASSQVQQGNADLATRNQEQAASLEECAATMEQITGAVSQNADNSQKARELALSAREFAERGGGVVGSAVDAMRAIHASNGRIGDIIGVIDEIAFQTNLLALNAAVEAARAGDQGRGFGVVASEVRALAQRSAEAAREVKNLISDSVEKVSEGSRLVELSGSTLEEITDAAKKSSALAAEIAAGSEEQAKGIEQVNTAVSQMDQMTQQNSAFVEELAAASSAMDDRARGLNALMAAFRVGEQAPTAGSPASTAGAARSALPDGGERPARSRAAQRAMDEHGWEEF